MFAGVRPLLCAQFPLVARLWHLNFYRCPVVATISVQKVAITGQRQLSDCHNRAMTTEDDLLLTYGNPNPAVAELWQLSEVEKLPQVSNCNFGVATSQQRLVADGIFAWAYVVD